RLAACVYPRLLKLTPGQAARVVSSPRGTDRATHAMRCECGVRADLIPAQLEQDPVAAPIGTQAHSRPLRSPDMGLAQWTDFPYELRENRSERDSNPRDELTSSTAFPVRRPRPTRRSLRAGLYGDAGAQSPPRNYAAAS